MADSKKKTKFNYHNIEVKHQLGGPKVVRKVSITNSKGYKSVTKYRNGRKIASSRKPINKTHIAFIKIGKFIPGLFADCKCNKNKTRKRSKK